MSAEWTDLPPGLRQAITGQTGEPLEVRDVATGRGSEFAAVIHSAQGEVFVKGLRGDDHRTWTQQAEADVALCVQNISPRLRFHLRDAGWDTLGFDYVPGKHADYRPGSPDLAKIAATLAALGKVKAPASLPDPEARWAPYVASGMDRNILHGRYLVHTDMNPDNFIVGEGARLVDWGWATRGPAWIDANLWAVQLCVFGHTPAQAEAWASRVPALAAAPSESVTAFATAHHRILASYAEDYPAPGRDRLAATARAWAEHLAMRGDAHMGDRKRTLPIHACEREAVRRR